MSKMLWNFSKSSQMDVLMIHMAAKNLGLETIFFRLEPVFSGVNPKDSTHTHSYSTPPDSYWLVLTKSRLDTSLKESQEEGFPLSPFFCHYPFPRHSPLPCLLGGWLPSWLWGRGEGKKEREERKEESRKERTKWGMQDTAPCSIPPPLSWYEEECKSFQ